jgi:hypothetical protein
MDKNYPIKKMEQFTNSIWIVPRKTLTAYFTLNDEHHKVLDQTIWVINQYDRGYLFGTAYTLLDGQSSSKRTFVGSMTPKNDVLFSFYENGTITVGQGHFQVCKNRFLMQTNSLESYNGTVVGVSHWSYMIPITPCDPEYRKVPGTNMSIPEIIS